MSSRVINKMWTIIKFDKKNLELLKKDFKKKLGEDITIYSPKIFIEKYKKNKLVGKEFNLLGDYLFCFHKKFQNPSTLNLLQYTKGLKYFLNGFYQSQEEIKIFIKKCKDAEDTKGHLTQSFIELCTNSNYQFISGPFAERIFKIINMQKNKIRILLGDVKATINKNSYLFNPI